MNLHVELPEHFSAAVFSRSSTINCHYLLLQVRFVQNVTAWREMKPGFYHGHVAYLDFSK